MLESLKEVSKINEEFPYNQYLKEAEEGGKKIIGWLCNYMPGEIIQAAGMIPTRIMGGRGEIRTEEATAFLNIYSCPFVRTILQLFIDKEFDFLDGLFACNVCDKMRRLADALPFWNSIPVFYTLSVPHKMDEDAVKFYANELEICSRRIEEAFGVSVTDQDLVDAIRTSNQAKRLLSKLYSMRKEDNPPLSGSQVQEILNVMVAMPLKEFIALLETILSEIEAKRPRVKDDVRLMLSGSILNNYEFIKGIEDLGGVVVIDALCNGNRHWWGEIDLEGFDSPMEALASYYLKKFPCPRMYPSENRFQIITDLAKEYKVDGVITTVVRYCHLHIFDAPRVRDRLLDMDIPVLTLDLEYGANISGQVKTRVQAFTEMLRGRRENR